MRKLNKVNNTVKFVDRATTIPGKDGIIMKPWMKNAFNPECGLKEVWNSMSDGVK